MSAVTAELSLTQVAVLATLMVQARELTNAELIELTGSGLMGDDRRRLVSGGLILERRVGRSYAFELSPEGWSTGISLLAGQARGKGAAATTIRMLLHGLDRALVARGVDAKSFFSGTDLEPAVPDVDTVEERIRAAYRSLATEPAGWVSLADLRELLADIPRPELDTALKWMAVQPGVRLIPVANQKSLSTREHDAALRFGGEENHAFAIEG